MTKSKTAPSTAEPSKRKPRTKLVARSRETKTMAYRMMRSVPEYYKNKDKAQTVQEHTGIPLIIYSTITNLGIKGIEMHYDIPGYDCIIAHDNVIIHSMMAKYDEAAHAKILECNRYENPLECLKEGRGEYMKEVERPKLFFSQMTTRIARDCGKNMVRTMRENLGHFVTNDIFDLESKDGIRYYEYNISDTIGLACEALDHGDKYIMETYR
ncbi:hypothetical protein H4219_004256 [Mycoemilia scoparia]|uniref:Uncharacterized protein n=1 Tax=Mycoemilia scoparia TaxID=417184 RepID=A0A9W7ZT47_9FUNG|nr:hypothetical protein H4219_004256 [Mycoemilia scoparia]